MYILLLWEFSDGSLSHYFYFDTSLVYVVKSIYVKVLSFRHKHVLGELVECILIWFL